MNTTKIIILDFDGTLGDTTAVIIKTMLGTIQELGLPSRTEKECAAMIGLRLTEVPSKLFPECNLDPNLYALTYRRLFNEYNVEGAVELYPNVIETLTALKESGQVLTIASSRSNASLNAYIENLGLSHLISYVLGGNDVQEGKPHPEAVNRTLRELGFQPEEAIVVGDTIFDIHMGLNAGTRTCGVTYGNGTRDSLSDATWLIDDFAELLEKVSE